MENLELFKKNPLIEVDTSCYKDISSTENPFNLNFYQAVFITPVIEKYDEWKDELKENGLKFYEIITTYKENNQLQTEVLNLVVLEKDNHNISLTDFKNLSIKRGKKPNEDKILFFNSDELSLIDIKTIEKYYSELKNRERKFQYKRVPQNHINAMSLSLQNIIF